MISGTDVEGGRDSSNNETSTSESKMVTFNIGPKEFSIAESVSLDVSTVVLQPLSSIISILFWLLFSPPITSLLSSAIANSLHSHDCGVGYSLGFRFWLPRQPSIRNFRRSYYHGHGYDCIALVDENGSNLVGRWTCEFVGFVFDFPCKIMSITHNSSPFVLVVFIL